MRLATAAESRRIDERSQAEFGLSGEVLMEAAGSQSAREIEQSFYPELRASRSAAGRPIVIVCGPGNNGGDGLVVARHLDSSGHKPIHIVLVGPSEKRTELFRLQLERCRKIGLKIDDFKDAEQINDARLIIDAIFGTGIRGEIKNPYLAAIDAVNTSGQSVVALDAPSGLDVDRGVPCGVAVQAAQTIAFGLAKPGFFVNQGPKLVGRLRILSIGFPRELLRAEACSRFAFTERMALSALPKWRDDSHKSDHGHALIFSGNSGTWGAALLAASSAYRIGAGYVTLASHRDPIEVLRELPEILTASADRPDLWQNRRWTAAAIGPGLGTGDDTYALLKRLIDTGERRIVVDADAISVIARKKIRPLPADWILTPHAGELSRLIPHSAKEIEANRYEMAIEASNLTGCHVLLKGYRTVLAHAERATVILSGNSALAKAGTGDVLTGMIAGLLAQGLESGRAAAAAAYIHGRISDEWVKAGNDRRSLEASDLREILPSLMKRLSS